MKKEDLKNKLNDFFLRRQFVRGIRIFIHKKLKPLLLKVLAGLIALIIIALIAIKIIRPTYLENVSQKASFYFQRFVNIDNQEYAQINVKGNNRTSKQQIVQIARQVQEDSKTNIIKDEYEPLIQKMTFEI